MEYNITVISLLHIFSVNCTSMVILSILKENTWLFSKLQMHSSLRYQVMPKFLGIRQDPENISSQNNYILYVGVEEGNTFFELL